MPVIQFVYVAWGGFLFVKVRYGWIWNIVRENTCHWNSDKLFVTMKGIVNRKINHHAFAISQDGPVRTVQLHVIFGSNVPCWVWFGSGKDSRESQIIIGAVQWTDDSFSIFSNTSDRSVSVEVSFDHESQEVFKQERTQRSKFRVYSLVVERY